MIKICKVCSKTNQEVNFVYNRKRCVVCFAKQKHENYLINKTQTLSKYKEKYKTQAEKDKIKEYLLKNKDRISKNRKEYRVKNRDKINSYDIKYRNNRRKCDINFKLKETISSHIRYYIDKNNKSILKYLPYTIDILKIHLESLFEPWMNWDNWGTYRVLDWDDNDTNTWKWQIDHIIPHSNFNYVDMNSKEFINCWSLNNLRPYSAKQNVKDGNMSR